MFCPSCGNENQGEDFCRNCNTNLVIITRFLDRDDSNARRSSLISRTGLVSLVISEGFAWTLTALCIFVLIIFLGTIFLPRQWENNNDAYILSAILMALILFCGIPLLLGLVLLLKDITGVRSSRPGDTKK